jgi:hypothetical protein
MKTLSFASWTLLGLAAFGVLYAAAPTVAPPASTRVEGTFTIPQAAASFAGRVAEIRLYKHDPRLADRPADLVEMVTVSGLAHTQGADTSRPFVIGASGVLEPQRSYYVTFFVLADGKRTHMGEAANGPGGPVNVLTAGRPDKITLLVGELKN